VSGMVRGVVKEVREGAIKRFDATGRKDEEFTDRELFQHYGFTSRPLEGAEAVMLNQDNHLIVFATDDRRYRIACENGEVCIYTDEGDYVHLRRDNKIFVYSGKEINIEAAEEVNIKAGDKIYMESPLIEIKGDVEVDGKIHATETIIDDTGNTNHHSH
jgi:phage baseplate assembly protein V